MNDRRRGPGRPRKWASDAERMRATRAAKREQRLAEEARNAQPRETRARTALSSPTAQSADEPRLSETTPTTGTTQNHAECKATIDSLRSMLVDLEERYEDLVLSRWMLSRKYEHALGRTRSHDPAGIVWLVERLAEWERDNEARRIRRLQEPHRELVRRRYEEEFDRRLDQVRRQWQQ